MQVLSEASKCYATANPAVLEKAFLSVAGGLDCAPGDRITGCHVVSPSDCAMVQILTKFCSPDRFQLLLATKSRHLNRGKEPCPTPTHSRCCGTGIRG